MTFRSTTSPNGHQFFEVPCVTCGRMFGTEDRNERFCSRACLETCQRHFHLLVDRPENCVACGRALTLKKQRRYARTCSKSCKQAASRFRLRTFIIATDDFLEAVRRYNVSREAGVTARGVWPPGDDARASSRRPQSDARVTPETHAPSALS